MRNTAIALKTSENGLNTLLQVHQEIIGYNSDFYIPEASASGFFKLILFIHVGK